jgi:hypothetical protein
MVYCSYSSTVLNFGTRLSGQLHAPATLPRYPLYRRVGGSQSRSESYREERERDLLPLPGIEPLLLDPPACSLVAIRTELSRLPKQITN